MSERGDYREAIAEMRAELLWELRMDLSSLQHIRDTGRHAPDDQRAFRESARAAIRRIRALDQLRAESGLLAKAERLMQAGWQVSPPKTLDGKWWLCDRHRDVTGPTLTAALKSAPEPEK